MPLSFPSGLSVEGIGADVVVSESEAGYTLTGTQPPEACTIFAFSLPTSRGIEGPVRSMSNMQTDRPRSVRESASWSVTEDFPTPPFPERTYKTSRTLENIWNSNIIGSKRFGSPELCCRDS